MPRATAARAPAPAEVPTTTISAPIGPSRDLFVVTAIVLVAAALGVGAYAQLHLGLMASGGLAISVLVALVALHLLKQRGQAMAELQAENQRLRSELDGMARSKRVAMVSSRKDTSPQPSDPVAEARAPHEAELRHEDTPAALPTSIPPVAMRGGEREAGDLEPAPVTTAPSRLQDPWSLRPGFARDPSLPPLDQHDADRGRPRETRGIDAAPTAENAIVATTASAPMPEPAPAVEAPPSLEASKPPEAPASTDGSPRKPRADFDAIQALIKRLAQDLNGPRRPAPPEEPGDVAATTSAPSVETSTAAAAAVAAPVAAADPQETAQDAITRSVVALRQTTAAMKRDDVPPVSDAPLRSAEPPMVPAGPIYEKRSGEPGIVIAPRTVAGEEPASAEAGEPTPSGSPMALIASAVAAERYEVVVEPIQSLKERKARHFEIGLRLLTEDGNALDEAEYVPAARGTDLLSRIDAAKLLRTAKFAERLVTRGKQASVHSAISGDSLASDAFLDDFATTLDGRGKLASVLVLGFAQSEVRTFSEVHWETLRVMAELGLRFSLEHVTDLDMDFEGLKSAGFEFVKLDAAVFLDGLAFEGVVVPADDLCRHLSDVGLALVVSHIKDELALAKVLGFGVLLGQGELFGRPRPVDVDVGARAAA